MVMMTNVFKTTVKLMMPNPLHNPHIRILDEGCVLLVAKDTYVLWANK
jgi:hypothetical protein